MCFLLFNRTQCLHAGESECLSHSVELFVAHLLAVQAAFASRCSLQKHMPHVPEFLDGLMIHEVRFISDTLDGLLYSVNKWLYMTGIVVPIQGSYGSAASACEPSQSLTEKLEDFDVNLHNEVSHLRSVRHHCQFFDVTQVAAYV